MTGRNDKIHRAGIAFSALAFCALPLWEAYRCFWQSRVQIGPVALEEAYLLLLSLAALFAGCAAAFTEKRRRALWAALGCLGLLGLFTLIHAAFAAGFNGDLLPGAAPSFVTEVYGVLRLYLAPAALTAGLALLAPDRGEIEWGLRLCAALFALTVVLCCLFGVGFAAYRDGNQRIDGSFFTWFSLPAETDFAGYTVKGLFLSGNDVGAVLLILAPFPAFAALGENARWFHAAETALVGLAAVMVGTRVATLGFFATLIAALAVTLFDGARAGAVKAALKRAIPAAVCGAVILGVYFVSPGFRMRTERPAAAGGDERALPAKLEDVLAADENETEALGAYLEKYAWHHRIDPWFVSIYPPAEDPVFWRRVLARDPGENADNRAFKTDLIARAAERDGRRGDVFLGVGRTSGVPYSEKDLVYQVQVYGAVGAPLLLLPFAGALIAALASLVRRLKRRLPVSGPAALALALIAAFGAGYLGGHVFDTPLTTYALTGPAALAWEALTGKESPR